MKRLLITSIAMATLATSAQANVFMPNIGVDGWDSDGLFAGGAALQQGYLTLGSDQENHFINPAYSLGLQDSAQANMNVATPVFSGGVWTNVFGQNMGLYLGRPNTDTNLDGVGNLYGLDTTGNGTLDSSLTDINNRAGAPASLFDLYWADSIGAGDIGVRLNVRARGISDESQIKNDNVENTTTGGFYQTHLTVGFVGNDMPLEATANIGLPFGSYTNQVVNDTANTDTISELGYDSGLRWGSTVKYTLQDSADSRLLVSGFIGGTAATYGVTVEDVENDNQTTDDLHIQSHLTFGVTGSYEQTFNERTRMVASLGLTRSSYTIGYENQLEGAEQENYAERVRYRAPVALGIEFDSSERNTWSASVSDFVYTNNSMAMYTWTAAEEEAEEANNTSTNWGSTAPRVRFGLERELVDRLHGSFVINRGLVSNTFNSGFATHAQLSYDF